MSERINKTVTSIINEQYANETFLQTLKTSFSQNGYVKLPKFLSEEAFKKLTKEVNCLYAERKRKDFTMPIYNTDRKMSVISGRNLVNNETHIIDIYSSTEVRNIVSYLVGEQIHTVSHEDEFIVVNFLDGIRDTHGWHLDDPQYALIAIIETPNFNDGGYLEYIPNWKAFTKKMNIGTFDNILNSVEAAKKHGHLEKEGFDIGDCYLLNAADNLHRVSPMLKEGRRKAVNFAFDDRKYRIYGETATTLYE